MCLYFVRQLPQRYAVRLDSDVFLSAFSTEIDNRRQVILPWTLAPGWRSVHIDGEGDSDVAMSSPDQRTLRQSALDRWNDYYVKYSSHIPFCIGDADRVLPDANGVICGNADVRGGCLEQSEEGDLPLASSSLSGDIPGRYPY